MPFAAQQNARRPVWPVHGWLGLALVALFWPLNWVLPGLRTHLLFFPLWLGYILTVDAIVLRRRGSSLLSRSPAGFAWLFVASAPAWWLFELLNRRLGNWEYLGEGEFGPWAYFLTSSLSFSTVIPAVFETAELVAGCRWAQGLARCRPLRTTPAGRAALALLGAAMLALLLAWPRYFYPFTWLALIFLLDPLAYWWGKPSLLGHLARGNRRPLVALALGALVCGFFWELWNVYSYPKWIYHIPFFQFGHLFEMPALGYLGYLPFGLELYPLAHLLLPSPPELEV